MSPQSKPRAHYRPKLGQDGPGIEAFVDALGAPTMLAAQDLAKKCQTLLNEGQQILTELNENNRFDWITENFPASGIMSELGADAAALIGDHSKGLSGIDSKLQKIYGRSEPMGAGTGMQFHMARYLAVTLLDAKQCQSISSEMESALLAGTNTKSLFSTNTWQDEHARVTALLSASMHMVSQLAENDATDLEAVNAWMDVVIKCRDGLIRHGLATIAADSEAHYKKLVRIGTGSLIKDAAVKYPSLGLNEGLSPILRNAAAHLDYDITGDGITTTVGERPLFLTTEEFVDQVLAYLEVAVGLAFGLSATLSALEVEVDLPKHIARRDRDNIIGYLLGASGLDGVSLSYNLSTLHIEAQGSLANWMSTLASISGIIDPKIEHTVAHIADSLGVMQYRATLAPYREFFEIDNPLFEDRTLALVAAAAETTLNGRSIWSESDWSNAAAAILIDRPEDTPTSRIQRIKHFLQYLPETQFPKVVTLCGELLTAIRSSTINPSAATIPASFQRLQIDN